MPDTYADRVVALIHERLVESAQMTQEHLALMERGIECGCYTGDCFECGYFHNCKHGVNGVLRAILTEASKG